MVGAFILIEHDHRVAVLPVVNMRIRRHATLTVHIDNTTSRGRTLRFLFDGPYEEFKQTLFSLGQTPIPSWVKERPEPEDAENYQTIFAKNEGAVAAPAAGLHFSRELFNRMILKDINSAFITLHMGIGNFRNVDVEDLSKHKTDSERLIISEETAELINSTHRKGHKVLAVGVTTAKGLETYVTTNDEVNPYDGWTNKSMAKFFLAYQYITNQFGKDVGRGYTQDKPEITRGFLSTSFYNTLLP